MKLLYPLVGEWPISTQYGEGGHMAIDYACPTGTKVLAAHDGVMTYERTDMGGIVARVTGAECYTRYCHLLGYWAINGSSVKAGDKIAISDNTGTATTGAHLHYEAHTPDGAFVNPLTFELKEEVTVPSLLSFQFQNANVPQAMIDKMKAAGVKVAKVINPQDNPGIWKDTGIAIIVRLYFDNEIDKTWEYQGYAGADIWWENAKPRLKRCIDAGMKIFGVEVINEGNPKTIAECTAFSEFADGCTIHLHEWGLPSIVFNFGEGNPFDGAGAYLKKGTEKADYLGLHEYRMTYANDGKTVVWNTPVATDGWHMLRYRKLVAEIRAAGGRVPKIIIGESGIDVPDGWRVAPGCNAQLYCGLMFDYEKECQKDGLVVWICPFLSNPHLGQWQNYNNDGEVNDIMLAHIKAGGQQVDTFLQAAQEFVFPVNLNAALNKYILGKGWSLDSKEFWLEGWTAEWGYDPVRNVRILCRCQAPTWAVSEYATEPN